MDALHSNHVLLTWAAILLVLFVIACFPEGPDGPCFPAPAACAGDQYEFAFHAPVSAARTADPWAVTPCGRVTHVRAYSDLH